MKENNTLRKAQLKMFEGLIEIDRICKIHKIDYWLDAGTLLGAVRHGGFIPWDDDIDICMTRQDFNRFLSLAPNTMNSQEYFLQTPYTDPQYVTSNIPCKFRINNTFILENHESVFSSFKKDSHHGLFVDIFPYDKYSNKLPIRKAERLLSIGYRLHILTKFKNLPPLKFLLSRISKPFLPFRFLEKIKSRQITYMESKQKNFMYGAGCETPFSRAYFIEEEIFPTKKILFEGIEFNCPNQYHKYLIKMFGNDYMTPPPLNEQKSHGQIKDNGFF